MIRALSMSGSRIRALDVCPTMRCHPSRRPTCSGVPEFVFDARKQHLCSDISSAHDIKAFQHLKVFNLTVAPSWGPTLGRSIPELKRLLASTSKLTALGLTFKRRAHLISANKWSVQHVFDQSFVAKDLQSLLLDGFSATQDGLRDFLNHHRSIKELELSNIQLDTGGWEYVLDDMRTALPLLKRIHLGGYLVQYVDEKSVELDWGSKDVNSVILGYILHGGRNPFAKENSEGVRYFDS